MFCCDGERDSLYWEGTPNGEFSVKTAYHLVIEGLVYPPTTVTNVNKDVWKAIWHADVSPKVKIFAWRVLCNWLPTGANFASRGLLLDNNGCVHCGCLVEDVHHTLFSCRYATQVWSEAARRWSTVVQVETGVTDNFLMMSTAGHEIFDLFLKLCWGLWNERNKRFHDNEGMQPKDIIHCSRSILCDFQQANVVEEDESNVISSSISIWKPPDMGFVKLNTDASWKNQISGLGFVCRDSEGHVLLAGSKPLAMVASVIEAEARCVLFAIESATEKGYDRLVVEMDSLSLARALAEGTTILSIANVMAAIRRLASLASSFIWSFVRRNGNRVAHELAGWAMREKQNRLFDRELPPMVEEAVLADLASS